MIPFLYRALLYPWAYGVLQILRPFLKGKVREMIEDKNNRFFEIKTQTREDIATRRPFWIHAASGEIEYARPVIRELKKQFPDVPVIVTFSSPSAKKILKVIGDIDAWGALPWDFEKTCKAFLETWRPRCWLIARTDVWPVMAEVCRNQGIPSLLFSATFASNSSRLRGASALITQWALNQLSEIHCVSESDLQQLNPLRLQIPIHVHGDTRFDQVFHRLTHPKTIKIELRPQNAAVLVAGSTWPEDERILIPAFKALKMALKTSCKWVLAPHEIHESHLNDLFAQLDTAGLTYVRYSSALEWKKEDVLVIDQVGILAELYTWGQVAFVGGSFRKQVHSVMEPLAAGLPVLVGPFHHNNREALVYKEKTICAQRVVTEVSDTTTMTRELENILKNLSPPFSSSLRHELQQHRHSSESVVEWCAQQDRRKMSL